jgi:hypothetical protein
MSSYNSTANSTYFFSTWKRKNPIFSAENGAEQMGNLSEQKGGNLSERYSLWSYCNYFQDFSGGATTR